MWLIVPSLPAGVQPLQADEERAAPVGVEKRLQRPQLLAVSFDLLGCLLVALVVVLEARIDVLQSNLVAWVHPEPIDVFHVEPPSCLADSPRALGSASKPETTSNSSSSMPRLTQAMEGPLERLQQLVDVLVGALHRCQTARVLAREGFGARAKERDEEIFADERAQRRGAVAQDLGQVLGRPGPRDQLAPPVVVQRQQPLADGRIDRRGRGAVVEEVELRDFGRPWCVSPATRICPTSGAMAWTELGTAKRPISGRPASARRA